MDHAVTYQLPTMREQKHAVQSLLVSTSFRISLIAFALIFGVLYVLQTATVSTKGYEISDLEQHLTELERETKKLDVQIAEHRSMHSIENRLARLNMVPADQMVYVSSGVPAVAKR